MASAWFESVAEAQRRAKRRLPKGVYGALLAGSERGLTVDDNTAAFAELGFAPHTAGLANDKRMATTVLGQEVSLPVLISPTGVQAVHPDGEVAVARAAAARGTAMGLPAVAEAVGDQVEVLLDGGIRRGADVAKALALGAKAVMIGRAYLWGLAANGQAGVENVLDLPRDGLGPALIGLGHPAIT